MSTTDWKDTDLSRMNGGPSVYWQEKITKAGGLVSQVQRTGNLDHDDARQLVQWLGSVIEDVRRWQQLTHARQESEESTNR